MTLRKATTILTATLLGLAVSAAQADWQLDNEQSSLFYLTTKNTDITELNTFERLHGSISDSGNASVGVDLVSVETFIPIRDERMREMFFHIDTFPTAEVNTQVEVDAVSALEPGERMVVSDHPVELTLNGQTATYELGLVVVALKGGGLQISNLQPLVIEAEQHELKEEVEALRAIVDIESITHNAPVNFHLVFEPK